ncbi:MAG: hypothetical protein QOJ59_1809 [Thermomicrobiales bacterium]|nr:hypothetical protein [Thermomicrobiales bacterium]
MSGLEEYSMQRIVRLLAVALAVLAVVAVAPAVVSAHETRDVAGGKYHFVVGFLDEPAYTGFKNSLDLRVSDNAQPTPAAGETATNGVEGLESTLQVEIIYGDQKKTLPLAPRFRTPGAYNAWVIPTAAGDYTFHIFGTINGEAIDENFTSSPEGFSSVEDAASIQFPQQTARAGTVAGTIAGGDTGGTGNGTIFGGFAAGLAVGAAGLWLLRRRGAAVRRPVLAPAGVQAGVGD